MVVGYGEETVVALPEIVSLSGECLKRRAFPTLTLLGGGGRPEDRCNHPTHLYVINEAKL